MSLRSSCQESTISRYQELKNSRLNFFKNSRVQYFKNSLRTLFKISRNQDFKISRTQNFKNSLRIHSRIQALKVESVSRTLEHNISRIFYKAFFTIQEFRTRIKRRSCLLVPRLSSFILLMRCSIYVYIFAILALRH